jgi:hypothetical protein
MMQFEINEPEIPGPNDIKRQTEYPLKNGDTLRVERRDPFGFYYLSLKSGGQLPNPYDGAYTSSDEADKGINAYLDSRRLEIGPSERPEIKYKPGFGPGGKKLEK